jgi:hypothetical protein
MSTMCTSREERTKKRWLDDAITCEDWALDAEVLTHAYAIGNRRERHNVAVMMGDYAAMAQQWRTEADRSRGLAAMTPAGRLAFVLCEKGIQAIVGAGVLGDDDAVWKVQWVDRDGYVYLVTPTFCGEVREEYAVTEVQRHDREWIEAHPRLLQ